MNYILFDDTLRKQLYPFTQTRAVAHILCGIWTMKERWDFFLGADTGILTAPELQPLYASGAANEDTLYINAAYFANMPLVEAIHQLERGQVLADTEQRTIAYRSAEPLSDLEALYAACSLSSHMGIHRDAARLVKPWDIFACNDFAIRSDFDAIQVQQYSQKLPDHVTVIGEREDIFVASGAVIGPCIINARTGPVYIGADSEVMEGCMIRGPFALKDHGVLKMGAKVYGATTIGEGSKVGGEVNNIVVFNNSNKGHDGFLGNAVLGEWCNLGADTNCSNLKNDYNTVKVWNIENGAPESTGLQFCGLLMGDHSKCGINTMFNTGTVVGVSCNVFGSGFPDKYIPAFTWGGTGEGVVYRFEKAVEAANRMMSRRNRALSEAEIAVLKNIYDHIV